MATVTTGMVDENRATKSLYIDARFVSFSITKAQAEAATIVQMIPVYAGETVLSVELVATDISTGTDILLDVGDGADDDRYIVASTIGQAGGSAKHTVGVPYTYTANDTIDVTVSTVATTGAAGTLTLLITVI
jgi:hypothetical protein